MVRTCTRSIYFTLIELVQELVLAKIYIFVSLLAFLRCVVIGESQVDERALMSKTCCCGHIRSCKLRCVWNEVLDPIYLFTLPQCHQSKAGNKDEKLAMSLMKMSQMSYFQSNYVRTRGYVQL